jgi:hypothetical protein
LTKCDSEARPRNRSQVKLIKCDSEARPRNRLLGLSVRGYIVVR